MLVWPVGPAMATCVGLSCGQVELCQGLEPVLLFLERLCCGLP